MTPAREARPDWLDDDLARVEGLLGRTAGASRTTIVAEAATHLLKAGGKRMRPALVLATARAGRSGGRATDLAAAALELVHLATLYHDDVIDETETRRGAPTAHSKWGTDVAVLAGDYLFARGCELGADAGGEVPGILSRAIADVCEGQLAEMETVGRPRDRAEYLSTVMGKTGSLFRAACDLGCATAGITGDLRVALVAYGTNLGIAFQLVDDILDLVGDAEVTGKQPGTDLREGVYTLPVILGIERSPELGDMVRGDIDLDAVLRMLSDTGSLADARAEATGYLERAMGAIHGFAGEPWHEALEAIAAEAGAGLAALS